MPPWTEPRARPCLMGILNVTPDSFSDAGRYLDPAHAVKHGLAMAAHGADIIDVGGESTRPGARRESAEVQIERILPVVRGLRHGLPEGVLISIDTTLTVVAQAALEAGAGMINDVSAGEDDPAMFRLAARHDAFLVLMHKQGEPVSMQEAPAYSDVVAEVADYLRRRAQRAIGAGLDARRLVLDPGIGFGKKREHNLDLLRALPRLAGIGHPLLIGTSRKRFMGRLCEERDPSQLLGATCATTALGVAAGVRLFRVHDVKANRQAADVAWMLSV